MKFLSFVPALPAELQNAVKAGPADPDMPGLFPYG